MKEGFVITASPHIRSGLDVGSMMRRSEEHTSELQSH